MSKEPVFAGQIQSTAGAVPVRKGKKDVYMQKVKVQRYVAGKRPTYADYSSDESDEDDNIEQKVFPNQQLIIQKDDTENAHEPVPPCEPTAEELQDPRIRRIMKTKAAIEADADEANASDSDEELRRIALHRRFRALDAHDKDDAVSSENENNDELLDDEQLAARRKALRALNLQMQEEKEQQLVDEDEDNEFAADKNAEVFAEEELEYSEEEYTSSEEESAAPRLKPVFVQKRDRVTLQAKQKAEQQAKEEEIERRKLCSERRAATLKMVESEIKREAEEARLIDDALDVIDSDEGAGDPIFEQAEYEKWKVRELKRIRREREKREAILQEKAEVERIHKMTDEERNELFRKNPKKITNLASKGQYKFLQKYYHRGAFFVTEEEDEIFKRNYAEPTLEDRFDKSKLPAVMQVKNFGMASRTKYTHLTDQDTTEMDSAWATANPQTSRFQSQKGGGFKSIFEKPRLGTGSSKKSSK